MTAKKDWIHCAGFLNREQSDGLYQHMIDGQWVADSNSPGDASAMFFALSYRRGSGSRRGEIPSIPDFLKKLADKVSRNESVLMPVNYIECHKYGPNHPVNPHRDPLGMIVPMLTLGQERVFRVGGTWPPEYEKMPQHSKAVSGHIPRDEYLMHHGDLLVFHGGHTIHSMFPAPQDPKFNANGFEWRISILFPYTTDAMWEYGPLKANEHGGALQYETAKREFRKQIQNEKQ